MSRPALAKIGLLPALSANVLNMVGVGPFLTIPLVLSAMGGPQAMLGWAAGAALALCDGLVWAEFGAAFPQAGGPYHYLREAFGPRSWGRLMSFLFLAQVIVAAPLTAASGAVGFAEYFAFLVPSLTWWQGRTLAVAVCLLATFLLYRNIREIGKISLVLTAILIATMSWIIVAGAAHFHSGLAFDFPAGAFHLDRSFFLGLGAATLIAMYDYSGYFNVGLIGGEVRDPVRNIPRCILLSIIILGFCYAAMSLSIVGVLPWREAARSHAVVSDFVQHLSGPLAAQCMTVLILIAAFGSVYTVLLGYSRVPYAAAFDGHFFRVFATVHPTKGFPSVAVLTVGLASAAACLLSLDALIKLLLVIQIATQFAAQCVGLMLIRRFRRDLTIPFAAPLFPMPPLIALCGWLFLLASSGITYLLAAATSVGLGVATFLLWARRQRTWPFHKTTANALPYKG